MTQRFEERLFRGQLETEDGEKVVAAYDIGGTQQRGVLVRLPDSFVCGADTAEGTCEREVSDPDERCWQHEPAE